MAPDYSAAIRTGEFPSGPVNYLLVESLQKFTISRNDLRWSFHGLGRDDDALGSSGRIVAPLN